MKKNNKKGFTLVELVIVVAVMAILVAVAIPVVGNITSTAKANVYNSNCQTIESMIKLEEAEIDEGNGETLDKDDIQTALEEAKLGITEGTFYYHTSTGAVNNVATVASGETVYTITFSADAVSVTSSASSTPAESTPAESTGD